MAVSKFGSRDWLLGWLVPSGTGTAAIQAVALTDPAGAEYGVGSPLPVSVDEGNDEYETVAASQTAQVLGTTGAVGDYLSGLILVVATAATAATSILDGATSIEVFPNSPGGGVGTYYVPLGIRSRTGGWSVTTGAGVAVIAVGSFT